MLILIKKMRFIPGSLKAHLQRGERIYAKRRAVLTCDFEMREKSAF
jgi:uncharacterized protein (DUF1786 family)